VSGRHEDEGRRLVAELRELGGEAEFLRADVRDEDDVLNLVDATVARFGRLDAAVNNAGTEGKPGPVTDQTAESYNATFETNVLGTLLSMKHELRVMLAQGHGSIVNVSSTYGRTGAAGASVYAASKHAVEGLTKSAAIEVAGRGVRVNAAPSTGYARRDRADHSVHRIRQGRVHHGRVVRRRRRQDGQVGRIASPRAPRTRWPS